MDLFDRIYCLDRVLRQSRYPVPHAMLQEKLECSRWVADEVWHPKQIGRFEDGRYVLEVLYSDSRELVMDILKHGPEVEVLEPSALRTEVRDRLARSIDLYQSDALS